MMNVNFRRKFSLPFNGFSELRNVLIGLAVSVAVIYCDGSMALSSNFSNPPFTAEQIQFYESRQIARQQDQQNLSDERAYEEEFYDKIRFNNQEIREAIESNQLYGSPYDHLLVARDASKKALEDSRQKLLDIQNREAVAKNDSLLALLDAKQRRIVNAITLLHDLQVRQSNVERLDISEQEQLRHDLSATKAILKTLEGELKQNHDRVIKDSADRIKVQSQYPIAEEVRQQFTSVFRQMDELKGLLERYLDTTKRVQRLEMNRSVKNNPGQKVLFDNEILSLKNDNADIAIKLAGIYRQSGAAEESNRWDHEALLLHTESSQLIVKLIVTVCILLLTIIAPVSFAVIRSDFKALKKYLSFFTKILLNKELQTILLLMVEDVKSGKGTKFIKILQILRILLNMFIAEGRNPNAGREDSNKRSAGESSPRKKDRRKNRNSDN
jgi:hypothetical protein